MNPTSILLALAALRLYTTTRTAWIAWQAQKHATLAHYWARRTQQGAVVLDEALGAWSFWQVLLHPSWVWRSFVVRQDLYDELMAFAAAEAARPDLTLETYLAEMQSQPEATTEPAATGDAAQPSTPDHS